MLGQPLVQTEEATDFFSQPDVLRKVMLGDPDKVDETVRTAVVAAHNAVGNGMLKVAALTQDKTRTEVQRHAAAGTVAEQTAAALAQTQGLLNATADRLQREAGTMIEQTFALDANRASIESEVRSWVREQASKPEGLATIREAMKEDRTVATVLWHGPTFLLGLAPAVRENMRIDAIEYHVPKAYKALESSNALKETATKYTAAIAKVRRTFFSKALADQAATRVEV
jgi:hypothetical protein